MDGQSALVVEVLPATDARSPLLFGAPGSATVDAGGVLHLTGVSGEVGTSTDLLVVLGQPNPIATLRVNDQPTRFSQTGNIVRATAQFAGILFHHAQQIGGVDPAFAGGHIAADVTIPSRVFEQLQARTREWPIQPTPEELRATWLAPERLLLHVQIAEPDDRWEARLTIDAQPVQLQKAYTAIPPEKSTFVGFYADLSRLSPDEPHRIELELPALSPGQFQGLFLDNVETEYTARTRG